MKRTSLSFIEYFIRHSTSVLVVNRIVNAHADNYLCHNDSRLAEQAEGLHEASGLNLS